MLRSASKPWAMTSARMVSRSASQRRAGPGSPDSRTPLTILSAATQAITLEWVKWRFGPRISHSPLSGWSQTPSRYSISATCTSQASSGSVSRELRVSERQSSTSPHTSSCSCPAAPLPILTGADFS
ncbi:hypothetical protein D9M69_651650 [compost metagenome]